MRKIILDCDPGHDDAIALMLLATFSDKFNIVGLTSVSGNQTIEKTTNNLLALKQYLKIKAPVYKGEKAPLIKAPVICEEIHGESGLDGFPFEKLVVKAEKESAVEFIIKTLKEEKVTIVATGPLTNIAKAILQEPKITTNIEEIILMGGSIGYGNVTPAAEFNIFVDPEAAEVIFKQNVPIKMIGLDVTRKVLVTPSIIERMSKYDNFKSKLFTLLMEVFYRNQLKTFHLEGAPLHDPVTIATMLDKNLVTYQAMNVEIDVSKGPSYGRTNCDRFDYLHREHNALVAIDIDVERFWQIIEEGIKR